MCLKSGRDKIEMERWLLLLIFMIIVGCVEDSVKKSESWLISSAGILQMALKEFNVAMLSNLVCECTDA